MSNIVIIDYGMGNLRWAQKAFEKVGFTAKLTSDPADIASADKLVLPGVGAFRDCIGNLRAGGFVEPLLAHVASGKPLLGICLGCSSSSPRARSSVVTQGSASSPARWCAFRPACTERRGAQGSAHGLEH